MKDSKEKKVKARNKQAWPGLRGCAESAWMKEQHPVLPYGHPSKHWRSSPLLNLGDCLDTLVCSIPTPWLVNNLGLKGIFKFHKNSFNFKGTGFYCNGLIF